MRQFFKSALAAASLAVLAACGGGGDGGEPSAEGLWVGTSSTGEDHLLAVMPSGESWFIALSDNATRSDEISYLIQGTTRQNGSSFSISNGQRVAVSSSRWQTQPGFMMGTLLSSTRMQLNGTMMELDSDYHAPLSLQTLAGTYRMYGTSSTGVANGVNVTMTSTGQVTVANMGNCTASGTVSTTGKNIASLTMTFTGSGCALGNGTTTRGFLVYHEEDGERLFASYSLNTDRNDGFVAVGIKQ